MTLNFPNSTRSYDETRRRVSFVGHDGIFEVPFFIQTDALPTAAHGEAAYLAAFDAAHASIFDAARKAYEKGRKPEYVLTAGDFQKAGARVQTTGVIQP
jgi:hypothetical protein